MLKTHYHLLLLILSLRVITMSFFKSAALSMEKFSPLEIITNFLYIFCLLIMVIRALLWHRVLIDIELSTAQLFMALVYPFMLVIGFFVFQEEISFFNVTGVLIIIFGVRSIIYSESKSGANVY